MEVELGTIRGLPVVQSYIREMYDGRVPVIHCNTYNCKATVYVTVSSDDEIRLTCMGCLWYAEPSITVVRSMRECLIALDPAYLEAVFD